MSAGAKGLQAVEKARDTFEEDPMAKYNHVVHKATKLNSNLVTNDQAADTDTMRVYFERRVPLKHSRLGVQMCTLINSVHAALKQDDPELALGRIAGAYQAMEQWATDGAPGNGMSPLA